MLLGARGVGRTALFPEGRSRGSYQMTSGADVGAWRARDDIVFQVWEINPHARFKVLRPEFYKGSLVSVFVYDVTDRATFETMHELHAEFIASISEDIPMIVIGNKVDLSSKRKVTPEEGEDFAQRNNTVYIEAGLDNREEVTTRFLNIVLDWYNL